MSTQLTVIEDCDRCNLRAGASCVVWGDCLPCSDLLVVADGPGKEEDLMGKPFCDRSGLLVRKVLAEAGFAPEKTSFTYAVKCHGKALAGNVKACSQWLPHELKRAAPKLVLSMGWVSTRLLLGLGSKGKLDDHVGVCHFLERYPYAVAPWWSPETVYRGGKKMRAQTLERLETLRSLCLG